MAAHNLKVNLLPPSEFELSFWGRFLKWAVTTGRYIIILTELIVILAFLSRFKLDEDLRKLNDQIQTQVSFLDSEQSQLDEFFRVQRRLGLVDNELTSQNKFSENLEYITVKTPPEIKILQYAFAKGEIMVMATTLSEKSLGLFITTLGKEGLWKSIDLSQISADPGTGIKFTLSARK